MRRWLCALQIGALASVLCSGVAAASMTLDGAFAPQSFNLSAQLFARCFGESIERSSFKRRGVRCAAARRRVHGEGKCAGGRRSATCCADAARADRYGFRSVVCARAAARKRTFARAAELADARAGGGVLRKRAPVADRCAGDAPLRPLCAADEPGAAQRLRGRRALSTGASNAQATVRTSRCISASCSSRRTPKPAQSDALQSNSTNGAVGAGATLNVRAGARNVGLDLSSALEHVTLTAPQFSAASASAPSLSGAQLPVFVPAYADVSAQTISTGVTVPVTRKLTASLQVRLAAFAGRVRHTRCREPRRQQHDLWRAADVQLARGSSAISLSTRQYHFQDNLLPSNALTQINTNLNFTIKF